MPPPPSFTSSPSLSPFHVPVSEYLRIHPSYEGIATGALIFSPTNSKLLIIQRASHDSMPNLWEIPGGACDPEDPSILHGCAREVWEETGLEVTKVTGMVGPGDVFMTSSKGIRVCKFTFVVDVEDTEGVTLDREEHQDWLWVSEEDVRGKRGKRGERVVVLGFTTRGQEEMILEGFRIRREESGNEERSS